MSKKKKIGKTNAVRQLDKCGVNYIQHTYHDEETFLTGKEVAALLNISEQRALKTLVVTDGKNAIYVCVVPSSSELDLKKAARQIGVKKLEMLPSKDVLDSTGYITGGCSPLGMKKDYKTFIEQSVPRDITIFVSAGKRGSQIEVMADDLALGTNAQFADLIT